jgi:hypothetical protein
LDKDHVLENSYGEARTLLFEARILGDSSHAVLLHDRISELRQERPALAQCTLVGKNPSPME